MASCALAFPPLGDFQIRAGTAHIVNHYNVQPVFDVLATAQDRDLGGIAADVGKVLGESETPPSKLPRGTFISVRGQAESMNAAFLGLRARPARRGIAQHRIPGICLKPISIGDETSNV